MRKRILATVLSVAMVITSLSSTGIEAKAAAVTEKVVDYEEESEVLSLETDKANTAWTKLYDYANKQAINADKSGSGTLDVDTDKQITIHSDSDKSEQATIHSDTDKSEQNITESNIENAKLKPTISIGVSAEDNAVIVSSVKDDEKLELFISENSDTSKIVFTKHSGIKDTTIETEVVNADLEKVIEFAKTDLEKEIEFGKTDLEKEIEFAKTDLAENRISISDELTDEEFAKLTESANELYVESLILWNDEIVKAKLCWADLGFEKLDSVCEELVEETIDDTIESEETIDAANENSEKVNGDDSDKEGVDEIDDDENIADGSEGIISVSEEVIADENNEELTAEEGIDENGDDENVADGSEEIIDDSINDEEIIDEDALDSAMPDAVPKRIELNYDSLELKIGETVTLQAKVFPENVKGNVKYFAIPHGSTDTGCISVDINTGEVTANYANMLDLEIMAVIGDPEPMYINDPYKYKCSKSISVTVLNHQVDSNHNVDEDGNSIVDTNTYGKTIITADGIWVGGFKKNGFTYTGKAITQTLAVYDKEELLTLNKDYSLFYRNNINVCDDKQINSPSVTITMKGQYSGRKTLYFAIDKAQLTSSNIDTDGIALIYNGREQKYIPTITFNGRKLVNNRDFTIEYDPLHELSDLKGTATGSTQINYYVHGKGNFADSGTVPGCYYITAKENNISKAVVTLNSTVKYTGTDITKNDLNLKIKLPGEKTFSDVDPGLYDVALQVPSTNVGVGKVVIKPWTGGDLCGCITKTFKIVAGYNLAQVAEVNSNFVAERQYYDDPYDDYNMNKQRSDKMLSLKSDSSTYLTQSTDGKNGDYTVTYTNYKNVGTVRVTFKGINAYTGTIVKTYKLVNNNPTFIVSVKDAYYSQGGAIPDITILQEVADPWGMEIHIPLKEKVDYVVKYKNNNAVGTGTAKITFRGKYAKGTPIEKDFNIFKSDISACKVAVADKAYTGKAGAFKSVPVVTAPNGKRLVAGKDYEKEIEYIFDDCDVDAYANNPRVGSTIMVKITGKGNYSGTAYGTYVLYDNKTYGLNKLFVSVDSQVYTGDPVTPQLGKDIHLYASNLDMRNKTNEIPSPYDYVRVVSYKNNIKAGTATIVLGGAYNSIYQYGGTKTATFKILKKNYDYNAVSSVTLSSNVLTLTSTTSKAVGTLAASINTTTGNPANNKNLIWKTSNAKVVSISASGNMCNLQAEGNGTAVISCTSQDGSKVAKCTVKSVMKPVTSINISKTSLSMKVGDMDKISISYAPNDAYMPYEPSFTSSNESVVTVDYWGNVKAVGMGIASIIATVGTKTAKIPVDVTADPATLTFIDVTDSAYGAIPNDALDDTAAINKAIKAANSQAAGNRNVKIPAGTYNITVSGEAGLDLNGARNLYIYMENGAVIKENKCSSSSMRGVFCLDRAQNVIIEGGTIDGNRSSIGFSEDSYGIMVVRSSDIQFKNLTVKNVNGDGIYIGKTDETLYKNENITIKNCTVDNCARNNIALVNGNNITIENTTSKNCTGYHSNTTGTTASGLGLDIEPNSGQHVIGVTVKGCSFSGNREDFGIHCHNGLKNCSQSKDITLDGCSFGGMIYIDCGSNLTFKNTVKKPSSYFDKRNNSYTFPD